jgi:predicted hydrolase (HD superfamily)
MLARNTNPIMTPRHVLKGQIMNKVKDAMNKLSGNKNVPTKKILLVVGTVVGIALTAGLIAKNKSSLVDAIESVKK